MFGSSLGEDLTLKAQGPTDAGAIGQDIEWIVQTDKCDFIQIAQKRGQGDEGFWLAYVVSDALAPFVSKCFDIELGHSFSGL
jgi:hypothetical protein